MPYLETERLILRPLMPADVPVLAKLWADPIVTYHLDGPRDETTVMQVLMEELNRVFDEPFDLWPVVEKSSGMVVGHCGLLEKAGAEHTEIELTYVFHQHVWGQGYATEIVTALKRYAEEELGVTRLIALIDMGHPASEQVAKKVGLQFDKEVIRPNGLPRHVFATPPL